MLILERKPASVWLTLFAATEATPEVRIHYEPVSGSAARAAIAAMAEISESDVPFAADRGTDVLAREIIRRSIIGWEGIGVRDDEGNVVPVSFSAEALEMFMSDPMLVARLVNDIVYPWLISEQEKNALSPSRIGTSGATMAAKDIAVAAPAVAKNAPTRSTRSKPIKVNASGK